MASRRFFPVVLLVTVAAGCSPYVYQPEVTTFRNGVDDLRTAFVASEIAVESAARDAERARWRSERRVLGPSQGCVVGLPAGSPPCTLIAQGTEARKPSPAQQAAAGAAPLVAALAEYAETLGRVVDASDRAELDNAMGALRANTVALAKRADAQSGGKSAAALGPVVGLFNAVTAAQLDRRRFQALRAGIEAADPAIKIVADPIGKALALLAAERLRFVRDEIMTLSEEQRAAVQRGITENEYDERTAALDTKTDIARALITAKPNEAVENMVAAHARLREAVTDPATQIESVITAVQAFGESAQEVRAALAADQKTIGTES